MSEMVERVARAIEETYEQYADPTPAQRARAAIEAMRVPTPAMVNAAWVDGADGPINEKGVLVIEYSNSYSPSDLTQDTAAEVWEAMIDAALKQ
jgi:hypothetical protein